MFFDGHATQSLGVLPAPNDAYRYDAAVDVVPEHAAAQRAGERTHAHPHTHTHTHTQAHARRTLTRHALTHTCVQEVTKPAGLGFRV